ncbi:hypothetical protein BN126_3280 [Cronobacter sakazakii 680]|nr:hypothetical protein BN126_3280 [Cronobacter sakazakii 680]
MLQRALLVPDDVVARHSREQNHQRCEKKKNRPSASAGCAA